MSSVQSAFYRVARAAGSAWLLGVGVGCGALSNVDDPPPQGATATGYSSLGHECTQCIDDDCADELEACMALDECRRMAECFPRTPAPIADAECGEPLSESTDARLRLEELRSCAKEPPCDFACGAGRSWQCVGAYELARPNSSESILRERLTSFTSDKPYVGTRVFACADRAELDCGLDVPNAPPPSVETTTDEDGWYQLELPMRSAIPNQPGFNGYFRFRGGGIQPHRVQYSVPISGDLMTRTQLFGQSFVEVLLGPVFGVDLDLDMGQLSFQVFDCLGTGAEGVALSLEPALDDPEICYIERDLPNCSASATFANGRGNGAILNLPEGQYTVTATLEHSGERVSREVVDVQPGETTHLYIFPDP